jgi:hypothetical protein
MPKTFASRAQQTHGALILRSADLKSAVSPNCIRLTVLYATAQGIPSRCGLKISATLRYQSKNRASDL